MVWVTRGVPTLLAKRHPDWPFFMSTMSFHRPKPLEGPYRRAHWPAEGPSSVAGSLLYLFLYCGAYDCDFCLMLVWGIKDPGVTVNAMSRNIWKGIAFSARSRFFCMSGVLQGAQAPAGTDRLDSLVGKVERAPGRSRRGRMDWRSSNVLASRRALSHCLIHTLSPKCPSRQRETPLSNP